MTSEPLPVRGRLSEQLLEYLVKVIVAGEVAADDVLPSEAEIAAQFEVSKPTARETLKLLQTLGLVTIAHGKRTIVNDVNHWDLLSPIVANAFRTVGRGEELEGQYWQLRRIVEAGAARFAAESASADQRAELLQLVAEMEKAAEKPSDMTKIRALDQAFHDLIGQASGNYALRSVCAPVYDYLLWLKRLTPKSLGETLRQHREIANAIAGADPNAAAEAMEAHVAWSETVNRPARRGASHQHSDPPVRFLEAEQVRRTRLKR
jgi:DNA-binding FadR family transcriptional regulator